MGIACSAVQVLRGPLEKYHFKVDEISCTFSQGFCMLLPDLL